MFIKVLDDNKILAGGHVCVGTYLSNSIHEFLLLKFNPDGSPDISFNGTGETRADFDTLADIANDIVVQSDGKIILAGCSYNYEYTSSYMTVARFNGDGTLDMTFGTNGKQLYNITQPYSWEDRFEAIALQADGKIICAGRATSIAAFMRLNLDGTPDTGFGNNGLLTYAYNSYTEARALEIQSDGKILWGGFTDFGPTQAVFITGRLLDNGNLDNTWGSNQNGAQITYITGYTTNCSINDIKLQDDGKLLACGYGANTLSSADAAVGRFLTGQNADIAFSDLQSDVYCFPNPSLKGKFITIKIPEKESFFEITVYDSKGMLLKSETQINKNNEIPLLLNEAGFYIISIKSSKTTYRFKQIVQ